MSSKSPKMEKNNSENALKNAPRLPPKPGKKTQQKLINRDTSVMVDFVKDSHSLNYSDFNLQMIVHQKYGLKILQTFLSIF